MLIASTPGIDHKKMMDDKIQQTMAEYTDLMDSLNPGKAGDYSMQSGDRFAVSPTGMRYSRLEAGMFPVVQLYNDRIEGSYEPSSETDIHRMIYQRFGAGAVVHTHSPWATTLASQGRRLKMVHYAGALAGKSIPLIEYHTYGTEALASAIRGALEDRDAQACLMENHGLICYGNHLDEAFDRAEAVEFTARIQCQAEATGQPSELTDQEIREVRQEFEDYGQ